MRSLKIKCVMKAVEVGKHYMKNVSAVCLTRLLRMLAELGDWFEELSLKVVWPLNGGARLLR